MAKVREYFRNRFSFEMVVTEGARLLLHCIYYPSKSSGFPRYVFENYGLVLPDLNYETCRFMSAVNKFEAYPNLDLNTLSERLSWPRGFFDE